ncbi:MAG: type II secretion system protein M [Lachnospiraceae bacterium]|nr:type II secretion system protein M [Lachnospiraceae bacterium]
MKALSKDFTQREKVLLVILGILLVLVFYYYVVDLPLRNQEQTLNGQKTTLTADVEAAEEKVKEYENMESLLSKMDASSPRMESYNNRTNEINFLNDLLANTASYTLGFSPVTVEGNQVRRTFSLSYTCGSYSEAMSILEQLDECKYRCLVTDVSCVPANSNTTLTGAVNVTVNATFYETLVGKTTDAGLPEEEVADTTSGTESTDGTESLAEGE